jgi:hypothetical protein
LEKLADDWTRVGIIGPDGEPIDDVLLPPA